MWGAREPPLHAHPGLWPSPYPFHRVAAEEVTRPRLLDGKSCSLAGLGVSPSWPSEGGAGAAASGSFITSGVGTL